MKLLFPVLVGCLAFSSPPVRAADEKKDEKKDSAETSSTTLDQFKLGETIANDPVTMESLKGKVVVLELWGIH